MAPVGRYWYEEAGANISPARGPCRLPVLIEPRARTPRAETGLAGKVYTGHTASGVFPHPPRPSLLSCWRRPVRCRDQAPERMLPAPLPHANRPDHRGISHCPPLHPHGRLVWRTITLQWSARDGTIAADTSHFPFGTRIFVPGWGWGAVQDRGGAIKVGARCKRDLSRLPLVEPRSHTFSEHGSSSRQGPARLDLYLSSREEALKWGRQSMNVIVQRITH